MVNNASLIKKYFNEKALSFTHNSANNDILNLLFNKGSLIHNKSILDVGCGTGILFNYFLKHNVKNITGIDISDRMIDIAKSKYKNVNLICDNIVTYKDNNKYDLIVIYNALPHIFELDKLFINFKSLLNNNGKVIIAFGQSREKTNQIHNSVPLNISFELPKIEELCATISKYFNVEYSISNDDIYEILCINKN